MIKFASTSRPLIISFTIKNSNQYETRDFSTYNVKVAPGPLIFPPIMKFILGPPMMETHTCTVENISDCDTKIPTWTLDLARVGWLL
jgi:hypothetical protein